MPPGSFIACLISASWIAWALVELSAQSFTFEPVGSIPGPAEMVKVQGHHAYVSADRVFTIFDVTDPAAPKRVGSYTFPEEIWSFRLVGSLAYVANNFAGLGILDVSNPSQPVLRGSFKAPGQVKSVTLSGTTAVLADHFSGLDFVDVSDPAKPASLGSFFLEGYARDAVSSGSLVYAVDSPAGFYILDVSKGAPTDAESSVQSTKAAGMRVRIEVSEPSDPQKLAVIVGGGFLHVFDVSDPASPKMSALQKMNGPQGVALRGTYAYIADGQAGLQVLDLAKPSTPTPSGEHKTSKIARDVILADQLVFVVIGGGREASEIIILKQARR